MKQQVIALGFFDGVHLGHAALLRASRMRAREMGAVSAALLFDRHPTHILGSHPVPLLNTTEERTLLMQHLYNIEHIITFPFDKSTAAIPWEEFIREILIKKFHACHLVAGYDFRFGYHGEGNTEKLKWLCHSLGIGCDIIDRVTLDGQTISSSLIRNFISIGDVQRAAHFLGHYHFFYAPVVHGSALGRRIGIPTINQQFNPTICIPLFGVYITRVHIADKVYRGVTNIGTRPTVTTQKTIKSETYILDFEGDLYDKRVGIELIDLIRPEKQFANLDDLQAAIAKDISFARKYPLSLENNNI